MNIIDKIQKRIPDCNHPLTGHRFIAVTKNDLLKITLLNSNDSKIRMGINPNHLTLKTLPVCKVDKQFSGILHNVVICQNNTIFTDNKPGTDTFDLLIARLNLWIEKEIQKFVGII